MRIYMAGIGGHIDLTHPRSCHLTDEQNKVLVAAMYLIPDFRDYVGRALDKIGGGVRVEQNLIPAPADDLIPEPIRRQDVRIYGSINKFDYELTREALKRVLVSYAYMVNELDWALELQANYDLFVDSGAFSVKSSGREVNLADYIEWVRKVNPTVIAALDVIGDPEATAHNVAIMEDAGLDVLPTFHFGGEDIKYLRAMVEDYDYIALGGVAGAASQSSRESGTEFYKRCFRTISEMGRTDIRVHGFGCTSKDLMALFPWYSVDSTSWLAGVKFGRVDKADGGIIYVDQWLREQYGNEVTNPEFWKEENDIVRRKIVLLYALAQVNKIEAELSTLHANYDWDWLTSQLEMF